MMMRNLEEERRGWGRRGGLYRKGGTLFVSARIGGSKGGEEGVQDLDVGSVVVLLLLISTVFVTTGLSFFFG